MSGSGGSDDPFDWSNERLIKEFCTPDRSWPAPPPKRWPDPDTFAVKLEEHDLDGELLLCYEDNMGPGGFESLCADLGITKIPHKFSLRAAIRQFQNKSPGYKAWKASQDPAATSSQTEPEPEPEARPQIAMQPSPPPKETVMAAQNGGGSSDKPATQNGNGPSNHATPEQPPQEPESASVEAGKKNDATNGLATHPDAMEIDVPGHALKTPGEPSQSKKRKRVMPTNISAETRPRATRLDSNEALNTSNLPEKDRRLWQKSKKGAYLGDWSITKYALLQGADPLDPDNADDEQEEDDNFGWAAPRPIPGGRRLQVHKTMQRYLHPSRTSVPHLGRTRPAASGDFLALAGAANPAVANEDDEVLPALGESDDEGYDTETWEAMEAEAKERAERETQSQDQQTKKRRNAALSVEAFDTVIADAIRDMETKWTEKRLQKLRRKEHKDYMAARRSGSLKYLADMARKDAERYGQRIDKLVKEMRQVEWKNEKEVRFQSAMLEATIEDRQEALYKARLYSSPTAPPKVVVEKKPTTRRRPSMTRAARVKAALEEGEEIITDSSSEEDDDPHMRSFIVDDEPGGRANGRGRVGGGQDNDNGNATQSDAPMDMSDDSTSDEEERPVLHPKEQKRTRNIEEWGQQDYATGGTGLLKGVQQTDAAKGLSSLLADGYPLEDMPAIVNMGASYWESAHDPTRLLCTVFSSADREQLARLVDFCTEHTDVDVVWEKFCIPAMENGGDPSAPRAGLEDDAVAFTRYFYIFATCRNVLSRDFTPSEFDTAKELGKHQEELGEFCVKLRTLSPYFVPKRLRSTTPAAAPTTIVARAPSVPGPRAVSTHTGIEVVDIDSDEEDEDELELYEVRPVAQQADSSDDDEDVNDVQFSHSPNKRRRVIRKDQGAQDLRDKDKARLQEQENRRKALYESLAQSGTLSQDQARLIINVAKEKHHGIVYVNNWIGRNIRDHQVEGVRFMWNQIIAPPESRKGCLLAHTMGLGKTMQVITLLVAIAESAKSPDESVSSQIPDDLKESKTLILCPSGLVENWQDELLAWAQVDTLGHAFTVTSSIPSIFRLETLREWAKEGGTLVVGYPMFNSLIKEFGREAADLLEETPNIVIADEAHTLKNTTSNIHQLTRNFRTSARIAMTGSPLANTVDEYYSMINWVAPNYLAAKDEFRATYSIPIREGLYRDSTNSQRRHALKMLKVLKDTVAPKIHRATVASLHGVLPEKREFILYLPLSPLQHRVYEVFRELLLQNMNDITSTVRLWNMMLSLTLLLAHPKILQSRLLEMKQPKQVVPRAATLPPLMVDELLAALNKYDLDSGDYSSKIMVLMGILDEAKRVGEKVLVFSQSRMVLDYLQKEFERQNRRFRRLDGDTVVQKRQAMVKDFNVGGDEVYLISTTAGGVGLNIQGANRVVIMDFKWNPIHEQQAIGRAYRIGQTRKVFVYWLIVDGTFETTLHAQAVFKTQLASRVVDKKNPQAWADQIKNYTRPSEIVNINPFTADQFKGHDVVLDAILQENAPTRNRVARIISTDTFEQEEPEDKLTREEMTEADNLVNMNKLRMRSGGAWPEGFQVVGAMGMGPPQLDRTQIDGNSSFGPGGPVSGLLAAPMAPMTPPGPSLQATAAAFLADQAAKARAARLMAMNRPQNMPPQPTTPQPVLPSLVLESSQPQQQPSAPDPMYAYDAFLSQPQPARPPMQIGTQNAADAGVSFTQSQPVVPSNGHTTSSGRFIDSVSSRQTQQPAAVVSSSSTSLMASPVELIDALRDELLSGRIVNQQMILKSFSATSQARRAVEEIINFFKLSGLPAKAQWGRLKALATKAPGFAEFTVYGAIAPYRLSSLMVADEQPLVDRIAGTMAEIEGNPGNYSPETTPNACAVFGSEATLNRIVERKLFDCSWTMPTKAQGSLSVARMLTKALLAKIATTDVATLTRYAVRAFRDPVFATAITTPQFKPEVWARMTPEMEAESVRRLHMQHMAEHEGDYRRNILKRIYKPDGTLVNPPTKTLANTPVPAPVPSQATPSTWTASPSHTPPLHATKPEPMDDAGSATAILNNIPSRPHSTTGNLFPSSSSTPNRPLGQVMRAGIKGETRSETGTTPSKRHNDPDHVKHHLKRSQARAHDTHGSISDGRDSGAESRASASGSVGEGPGSGAGPRKEGRPKMRASGSDADLQAMREVMERRKRKNAGTAAGGFQETPSPPAPSPPLPINPQGQVAASQPLPQTQPQQPHQPHQYQARRTLMQTPIRPPTLPSSQPAPSSAYSVDSTSSGTVGGPHEASFRRPPRIDPASQLQRGGHQRGSDQWKRDLLEADRRQQAKKEKANNRPKILPPPTPGSGPKAGDNARNPFVVD